MIIGGGGGVRWRGILLQAHTGTVHGGVICCSVSNAVIFSIFTSCDGHDLLRVVFSFSVFIGNDFPLLSH